MMLLLDVIRHYTSEAGVRSLERVVSKYLSKSALQIVSGEKKRVTITQKI